MKPGSTDQGLAPSFDRAGALRFPLLSRGEAAGVRYPFDSWFVGSAVAQRPARVEWPA